MSIDREHGTFSGDPRGEGSVPPLPDHTKPRYVDLEALGGGQDALGPQSDGAHDRLINTPSTAPTLPAHERPPRREDDIRPEKVGWFSRTRNKVAAIMAGVAIFGGGATGVHALSNSSDNHHAAEPVATSTANPGASEQAPSTAETPASKEVAQDGDIFINGEKVTPEYLVQLTQISKEKYPDPAQAVQAFIDALTAIINLNNSPTAVKLYDNYTNDKGQKGTAAKNKDLITSLLKNLGIDHGSSVQTFRPLVESLNERAVTMSREKVIWRFKNRITKPLEEVPGRSETADRLSTGYVGNVAFVGGWEKNPENDNERYRTIIQLKYDPSSPNWDFYGSRIEPIR